MGKEIFITGAVRTAIGKFGGSLASMPAPQLGAIVIREAVHRSGILPENVDQVLMGCALQGAQGQNVARQASIGGGIPIDAPAITMNCVCGSGLATVNMAAALIASGNADIIVAGGMENMSAAPYAMQQARFGYRMGNGQLIDTLVKDGLWDAFNDYHMGITAENLAEKYSITREMQDDFAVGSQVKCENARKAGIFVDEIIPITVKSGKTTIEFAQDESPRDGVTIASLGKLKPAFKPDGTVTAGNASSINDGAAAVVMMSDDAVRKFGVAPMGRFVAGATAGVDPSIMGIGPVSSTNAVLAKSGLKINDMDLIEGNEAFASQYLAVEKLLELDRERVNVNGGALALGHPVGASGTRILVTLLYEMRRRGSNYGLATLCVGGGMGVSSIVAKP